MKAKKFLLAILILAVSIGCNHPEKATQNPVKMDKLLAHVDSGFIDKSGKLAIGSPYRFHGEFSNDLARVWKTIKINNIDSDKWGYIDATGKFVIEAIYDWALPFSDDLAAVNIGGQLVNKMGVKGADILWAEIKAGKWVFINKKGKVLFETSFSEVRSFHDSLAPVKSNDKWGYIDKTGKIVVPLQFDDACELHDGMGAVLLRHKWGFINKSGKQVVEPKYSSRLALMDGQILIGVGFSNGLAWVDNGLDYKKGKKWGVIDTTGKFVIEPQFEEYGKDFCDGLSAIKINGKYCIIDKSAKVIAETQYDDILEFSEGMASFIKGKKWGAIDISGKVIIEPQFDNQFQFSQGMAAIGIGKYADTTGYIDKSGKWVIPPQKYGDAWKFKKVYFEKY